MRNFRSDTYFSMPLWTTKVPFSVQGEWKYLLVLILTIMSFLQNWEDPAHLRSTKNSNCIQLLKNIQSRLTKRNCSIMAGCLSKSKELLRLIPDLQCHDCKNVPGPNENQKNRYSCVEASHFLCEEHKTECPCGSKVKKYI